MKKHSPERRSLLKAAAGFGGGLLLGSLPFKAFAQAATLAPAERCFVFVYFNGGWDQLLAFDPRDPAEFTDERLAETKIQPGYDRNTDLSFPRTVVKPAGSNIAFGPAIGNLANHYDQMAVIRGINMNTLGHDVGFRYFLTGKEPIGSAARGSSTATEIVGQMAPKVPIPSIALNIESYNDRYPGTANALKVNRSADLILTLSPSSTTLDSEIEKQLVDFRGRPVTCESQLYDSRGLVNGYEGSRDQMRAVVGGGMNQAFEFNRPENAAVRAAYGLPANGPYDSPAGRAALAATALKRGISQCVSITMQSGLDTHFGTQALHAQRLRDGFNALAALVTDLKNTPHPSLVDKSFMDVTTVMVFSEFSRTPMINGAGGRDHHLCSSALLMGAGVKHNTVYGKSGDIGMAPGLIDLKTGLPSAGGRNIFPEEVVATVLASAKLDYSITRTEPLTSLLA